MEDFLGFLVVIIGVVAAIVNSTKKQKAKAQTQFPPIVNTSPQQARPAAQPSMANMLPPRAEPAAPLQPQVHTHLEPDCEVHDQPGSLGVTSAEGKDPCHAEQLNDELTPLHTAEAERSGLTLEWSGDAMVKAFVMQEVLTRPCQRRAR